MSDNNVFTDNDLKRLKACILPETGRLAIGLHDWATHSPIAVNLEALLARLEAAEEALDEGECIVTHPCFCEGTKSFENLPQGLVPRVRAFEVKCEKWRKAAGK